MQRSLSNYCWSRGDDGYRAIGTNCWLAGLLHWTGESLAMDGTGLCLLAARIAVSVGQALHCNNIVPCWLYTRRENGHERTIAGDTAWHAFVSGKAGTAKGFSLSDNGIVVRLTSTGMALHQNSSACYGPVTSSPPPPTGADRCGYIDGFGFVTSFIGVRELPSSTRT